MNARKLRMKIYSQICHISLVVKNTIFQIRQLVRTYTSKNKAKKFTFKLTIDRKLIEIKKFPNKIDTETKHSQNV